MFLKHLNSSRQFVSYLFKFDHKLSDGMNELQLQLLFFVFICIIESHETRREFIHSIFLVLRKRFPGNWERQAEKHSQTRQKLEWTFLKIQFWEYLLENPLQQQKVCLLCGSHETMEIIVYVCFVIDKNRCKIVFLV